MSSPKVSQLTAVDVEVIGSSLASICDEMGETLIMASLSPNIKERRDCTTCLFDTEGNSVAQAEHIPLHLGSLDGIVHAVLDRYPIDEISDGDSFVGNDPHTGGGTHLPDIVVITPVFVGGAIRAWAANLAHHADYADRGHANIFQEGIRIPAVRLVTKGTFVADLLHVLLTNFQVPEERIGDFKAQLAANRLAIKRYRELCERYGEDVVAEAGRELMEYTERKVRAGIARIPSGTYLYSDVFDSSEFRHELELGLALTVERDRMVLDFSAPPQVRAGTNIVQTALAATVYYAVKTVVGPDVPANSGLHRAIEINAPEGSVLNCVAPAAVNGRAQLCQRVVDLVHGALSSVIPTRVTAASNGAVASTTFSGVDPRTGEYYVYVETIGGGLGAGAFGDGLDGVHAHITNTSNLPVESLESEYPFTVECYELIDGSGGAGEYRGGMGIRRRLRIEHEDCELFLGISRLSSQPWGLEGGLPGASARVILNSDQAITDSYVTLHLGDTLSVETAGGGGYGSPEHRDPKRVMDDVRQERMSREDAARLYGIQLVRL